MRTVVAIPARLESSRLPGKVLADIGGKPMIKRVLENCMQATQPDEVILCTDNEELAKKVNQWDFKCILTSPECKSGSERIASVIHKIALTTNLEETLVINVQGDQPFIDSKIIDSMAKQFLIRDPTPEVLTPVYRMSKEKVHNPNVVKTLLTADGRAIYFSRSAIPHIRGIEPKDWHNFSAYWGHVGIYGYRADILAKWGELPYSPLENAEKLEQLRLIEAGIKIGTFLVEKESLSVDTPEQLEQAREIANAEK